MDPDVRGEFARHLCLELMELAADHAVARWTVDPALHHFRGVVHGGVHSSVVETLASVAAAQWYGDRGQVVGVNNNTLVLRAVEAGTLSSQAWPLHQDDQRQVWTVETRDGDGALVARGEVLLQNLPRGDDA